MLVGVGFLMLLLTSLQGWGMVGIIASADPQRADLLQESKRLHNLGLTGGLLAVAFGLTLLVLPLPERRSKLICRVLLPSLLIAPAAFCDHLTIILMGEIPAALQAFFFALQAASALGITVSLALIVIFLYQDRKQPDSSGSE